MPVETRPAEASDLPDVRALWRRNPVGGEMPFYYDGLPDKPAYRLYVVHRDGRLVGTYSITRGRLGEAPLLYLSDVVIDQTDRGSGVLYYVWGRVLRENPWPEVKFMASLIPEGNTSSRRMLDSDLVRVRFDHVFEVYHLPSFGRRVPETTRDYDQVCDLVNRYYREHALFRRVTPDDLSGRRNFEVIVARRRGSIVACLGIWNQRYARRLRLTRPGLTGALAMWLLGAWNRRMPHRTVDVDREVIAPILTEPAFAAGEEKAFSGLVRCLGWRRDAHIFQVIADGRSAHAPLVARRSISSVQTRLFVYQTGDRRDELPPITGPVYFSQLWP